MPDVRVGEVRQYATLLFADLCDYTTLSELVDPEEVAHVLHRIRGIVDPLVSKHGGAVNEWRGDGVLCTFGLPRASEDDARHAIEAALAIHAAVRGLEQELRVPKGFEIRFHSGLDTGLIFAQKREGADSFDLVGDAVNTAARLCARAGRDELWATVTTVQGLDEFFELRPVEAVVLKGKKDAVPARHVVAPSLVPTRFAARRRRGLTPLVGREAPLSRLREHFECARAAHGEIVTVVGSAGVGKSRLVEEFKNSVGRAARVLEGRCEGEAKGTPLQPFVNPLREVLGVPAKSSKVEAVEMMSVGLRRLGGALERHRPALLHLLGLEPITGGTQAPTSPLESLVNAVTEVLVAARAERELVLVLVLDDWQWADDAARQVLGNVIRCFRNEPALVVVTSRGLADPLLSQHSVVELLPLSYEESARLIASLLPQSFDLGLWRAIHERAGGNPLFLEELCRALPDRALSGEEALIRGGVPTTLRGIIQVRVERVPEEPARVLRAAAVMGNEVPRWLLNQVSEVPDVAHALDVLLANDLMYSAEGDDIVRFKHWMTREVVYEAVRLPERRRLHENAARALRAHAFAAALPDPHEALAYHYAGAGDHLHAAHFATLAGDAAAGSSSLDRARQQYRVALDAFERLGLDGEIEQRWVATVSKWAEASLYAPEAAHLDLIRSSGERALRKGDMLAAARADYWLGWFCYALGEQPPAIEHFSDALRKAESIGDQRLIAQLTANLGQSLAAAGEYNEAVAHLDRGLELKQAIDGRQAGRRLQRRPRLGFAYALACKGLLSGDRGDFPTAYRCFDEALDALRTSSHAVEGSCLGLLGIVQLFQGDWTGALETAARARATAERVNGPYVFAMASMVGGYARWVLERREDALQELLHAVKWMQDRGINLYVSLNYGYLAEALESAGNVDRAREYARLALDRAQRMDRIGETMAHRTLARLSARAGHSQREIAEHLQHAMRSALGRGSAREIALTELVATRLQTRAGAESARSADLCARFRKMGMHSYELEAGGGP